MNKKIILPFSLVILVLALSNLVSAVIFDVAKAREEEWERYEQYREDYIKLNDLEAYEDYISERNLMNNFGFKPASYYYISPSVLAAKYNPPLQGDAYYTENRGSTSSLYQPSAVKYYGEQMNGRYVGYIPSTLNGKYFDHPQMNGAQGYLTVNYPAYSSYNSYGYGYDYGYGVSYGSDYANYGSASNYFGIPSGWSSGSYDYGYGYDYDYGYGYGSYNYYEAYDSETEEPVFYARIAEPLSNGFYVVGFY